MARLVIVSNRVPIPKARITAAGGLAVALRDLLMPGSMWFGWSGRLASAPALQPALVEARGVTYATVDLTAEAHRAFYVGFANGALWPLAALPPRPDAFPPRGLCRLPGGQRDLRRRAQPGRAARRYGVGARLPSAAVRPHAAPARLQGAARLLPPRAVRAAVDAGGDAGRSRAGGRHVRLRPRGLPDRGACARFPRLRPAHAGGDDRWRMGDS